jgi:hypothetical protein
MAEISGGGWGIGFPMSVSANESYYVANDSSYEYAVSFYNAEGSIISALDELTAGRVVTTPENTAWMVIIFSPTNLNTKTIYPRPRVNNPSTTITYSPYSNICPISGRTSVGLKGCGKNLVNGIKHGYYIRAGNATEVNPLGTEVNSSSWSCTEFIKVKPNTNYVSTCPYYMSASAAGLVFYDKNKNAISGILTSEQHNTVYAFTTPNDCAFVRFSWSNLDGDNAQLELGTEATTYEPYTPSNDLTIQLGDTVYGGTLDVEKGELTVDKASIDLSLLEYTYSSTYKVFTSTGNIENMKYVQGNNNIISSSYKTAEIQSSTASDFSIYTRETMSLGKKVKGVGIKDSRYSDATIFRTAVSGQIAVYELATPLTIQLTPEQVQLLKGANTLWTDGDEIELTYNAGQIVKRNDLNNFITEQLSQVVSDQIDNVVAEQIDDVVANQIDNSVAEQITEPAATAAGTWLAEHVDPSTGYVIDNSLTIQGAAADAKAAGDAIGELKSALSQMTTEASIIPVVTMGGFSGNVGEEIVFNSQTPWQRTHIDVAEKTKYRITFYNREGLSTDVNYIAEVDQNGVIVKQSGFIYRTQSAQNNEVILLPEANTTTVWVKGRNGSQYPFTLTAITPDTVAIREDVNQISNEIDEIKSDLDIKTVNVKFEKGRYASYSNDDRYYNSLAETKLYMINAYPIVVDGASKVIFPAITLTDTNKYNIYWRDSSGANVSTSVLTCAVDNNTVNVPSGAYYLDIMICYSGLYDLPIKIVGGNNKTGEQQKRIYTKDNGEQVCFFEVNRPKDVYSACCFMLPPNYNATGAKVPLVLWFDGNMNYKKLESTFTQAKLPGLKYIRDEGYAVLQIYSWGSYFATKYVRCGDDQPYPSPTCLKVLETGLKWFCDRYNIDSENIHIVSKSMGGLISLFFVSHPIAPFRSVSMFSPIIDMFGLRGRYSDARKAIFEDNALLGDIDDFSDINTDGSTSTGVENYYFSDRCFPIWEANKGATARLNSAYAGLVGATFAENLAKSVADSRAWYADNEATNIYNHPEYKKISAIPCKIWGATHDPDVQYKAMVQVVEQLRNSGCDAELKSVNSYDHSRFDVNTTDAQTITTALGIVHENVPIGWVESIQWIRAHSAKY